MKANHTISPLFVLAGGFGARLQSVLDGAPKALAPVNEKPFLSLQIENSLSQEVNSFVFLLHHHADLIIDFLKSGENKLLKDCKVKYVVEPNPMGTGGATGIKTPTDQCILYLESNILLDQLIQQFQLMERYKVMYHEQARQDLKKGGAQRLQLIKDRD